VRFGLVKTCPDYDLTEPANAMAASPPLEHGFGIGSPSSESMNF
jgi:hypothetical protein